MRRLCDTSLLLLATDEQIVGALQDFSCSAIALIVVAVRGVEAVVAHVVPVVLERLRREARGPDLRRALERLRVRRRQQHGRAL